MYLKSISVWSAGIFNMSFFFKENKMVPWSFVLDVQNLHEPPTPTPHHPPTAEELHVYHLYNC